jgi:dihydropteroate synthase
MYFKDMDQSLVQIMGILNVTPDSFSDGGLYLQDAALLKKVKSLLDSKCEIIDIGAEASGPGSKDVSEEEELKRLMPALKLIKELLPKTVVSIDTYKTAVAKEALAAGANIINDITALRGDANMAKLLGEHDCQVVMMYSKDNSARTSVKEQTYPDVIKSIAAFFEERISYAKSQGIKEENIILDPGMGHFISSLPAYSYEIIARLKELKIFEKKLLIGISRKSFLGGDMSQRDSSGLPLTAIAYINGADIIRTHTPAETRKFLNNL